MIVQDILTALEAKVASLLPTYKKSPFNYELEKNNRKGAKKIYAIRVEAGASSTGVLQSVTIDQNFEVILSDIYQPKNDNDKDLESKILSIHTDIETIYKDVYQKRLDLTSAKVLLVEVVDLSKPEIDLDNSSISIIATFKIRYRTQI
jgi:hypothetical protein